MKSLLSTSERVRSISMARASWPICASHIGTMPGRNSGPEAT